MLRRCQRRCGGRKRRVRRKNNMHEKAHDEWLKEVVESSNNVLGAVLCLTSYLKTTLPKDRRRFGITAGIPQGNRDEKEK